MSRRDGLGDDRERWGSDAQTMANYRRVWTVVGMFAKRHWIGLEAGIGRLYS